MPAFRVSSARSASGGSSSEGNGCIPDLSGGGPANRPGLNRRSGFVDGQGETCQRQPRTENGTSRRSRRTPSNCVGALRGRVRGRSPAFTAGRSRERLRAPVPSERQRTALNETELRPRMGAGSLGIITVEGGAMTLGRESTTDLVDGTALPLAVARQANELSGASPVARYLRGRACRHPRKDACGHRSPTASKPVVRTRGYPCTAVRRCRGRSAHSPRGLDSDCLELRVSPRPIFRFHTFVLNGECSGLVAVPQPTTTSPDAGAPTNQARVCLAAPRLAATTLPVPLTRASPDCRHVLTAPDP